jgi:poly(ADP-ribose) glycohydrolase ARH3
LHGLRSFEEFLYVAILYGGERDTLGAISGAISSAYPDFDAIPEFWRSKLENRTYIEDLASTLKTKV